MDAFYDRYNMVYNFQEKYMVCMDACYDRYNAVYYFQTFIVLLAQTRATVEESRYTQFSQAKYFCTYLARAL